MKIPDFTKLIKFDRKFFEDLGKKNVIWHKMNIQIDGINARTGNPFVKYTPDYKRRKAKGKAVKQGEMQRSRKIDPPNLTLTGAMMDSFKFIKSSNKGYIYGITDAKQATNTNLRKKRIVSDKENPLPPKVKTKVTTAIAGRIAENFRDVFTKKGYVVTIIKM